MFESFKKFFSKSAGPTPAAPPAAPAPAAPAPPARPGPSQRAPAPATNLAAAAAAPAFSPVPPATGDAIQLPLNDVLAMLPGALAPLVASRPGGTFQVPVNVVWEQIRSGAIRIPFGQLRQVAPPGTFADDASHDDSLIDLPLKHVLAAIGPAALPRRADQKRLEVPDEVAGVFGARGLASPAMPAPAAPPTPQPKAPAPAPAPKPVTPIAAPPPPSFAKPPAPVLPKPPAPPAFPKTAAPVIPAPTPVKPASSITPPPSVPKPPSHAPLPFAAPKPAPLPFATTRPAAPSSAAPAPAVPVAGPTGGGQPVVIALGAVCAAWPEAVRQEVAQSNLGGASVSIPAHRLEAAMKMGRVQFKWGELRGWLAAPPASPSAQAETPVELPLNVIAPLFLAMRRAGVAQKKITVGDNIPDLFVAFGKPATPSAPSAPSAAPPPAAAPAVAPAPGPAPNVLGELFGRPSKTEWTPQEIAQAISGLPGVAGGILAGSDGLLVAGQAPAPLKSETVAAFLPQMFGRMAGYTTEVQLGALQSLTLNAGSAVCAMFKAGALYLAVLGKPGQALPEAALLRVAAELAKRSQL